VHIYSSYEGFNNMPPAKAYSIFYLYPFLNIILLYFTNGYPINPLQWLFFGFALFGVFMLRANHFYALMMGISALTESLIYLLIKMINPQNSWDGVLFSYLWVGIVLTIKNYREYAKLKIPVLLNGIIGAVGYYLRFWNVNTIEPTVYSLFSYLGIPFSYFNQYIINNIKPDHISGAFIIIISLILSLTVGGTIPKK